MHNSERFLGLELAGAKNPKTAFAVIEYYPQEEKVFLLDIFEKVIPADDQNGDEALIELVSEFAADSQSMGVNVPLHMPPCVPCPRKNCPTLAKCTVPAVKWMRDFMRKYEREFTPYTQRPVELYIRHRILPMLPLSHRFEVDEALGGNKAPLTARMQYLNPHFRNAGIKKCLEIWPKLSVAALGLELGLQRRTMVNYRNLEQGSHAREEILEELVEAFGVFIYERDMAKLCRSLAAFDALICAFTALLEASGRCLPVPKGFPEDTGWVSFPKLGVGGVR